MGNNNVMGLAGGVLAAIIVMMILFFTADQSCAAGNGTAITNFHIDPDVLFFYDDPESELAAAAATNVLNLNPLKRRPVFDCGKGRGRSYRSCTPPPQGSKRGEHCKPAPGGTYLLKHGSQSNKNAPPTPLLTPIRYLQPERTHHTARVITPVSVHKAIRL
ncbi:hypothetical protein WN943_005751 [Citrus x changshan-huyou]